MKISLFTLICPFSLLPSCLIYLCSIVWAWQMNLTTSGFFPHVCGGNSGLYVCSASNINEPNSQPRSVIIYNTLIFIKIHSNSLEDPFYGKLLSNWLGLKSSKRSEYLCVCLWGCFHRYSTRKGKSALNMDSVMI